MPCSLSICLNINYFGTVFGVGFIIYGVHSIELRISTSEAPLPTVDQSAAKDTSELPYSGSPMTFSFISCIIDLYDSTQAISFCFKMSTAFRYCTSQKPPTKKG